MCAYNLGVRALTHAHTHIYTHEHIYIYSMGSIICDYI